MPSNKWKIHSQKCTGVNGSPYLLVEVVGVVRVLVRAWSCDVSVLRCPEPCRRSRWGREDRISRQQQQGGGAGVGRCGDRCMLKEGYNVQAKNMAD